MRALLLIALLALGGCVGRPEGGPVTLVFKYARILGDADPLPELLREFEAANPGVRVKGEALPWASDDQHQFYVINLEGQSPGFDVMMLDCIWVPEFARAGWLLDLTGDVIAWRRSGEQGAAGLHGPVTDLLLTMYRRIPVDAGRVEVAGDAKLIDFWLERVGFG